MRRRKKQVFFIALLFVLGACQADEGPVRDDLTTTRNKVQAILADQVFAIE